MNGDNGQLYRVRWYSGLTGQITEGVGAFSRDHAEMWVRVLNRDEDSKTALLHYWAEPVETEAEAERRE